MPLYNIGLDIGQHRDHASLAVTEELLHGTFLAEQPDEVDTFEDSWRIAYLYEWPLHTSPNVVMSELSDRIKVLGQGRLAYSRINWDATGVGKSWVDLIDGFHRAGKLTSQWPRAYTVTGEQVVNATRGWNVRKIDLMTRVQRLGSTPVVEGDTKGLKRLSVDPDLYLADRFVTQLQAISATPTVLGRLTFAAPQAVHDDLVSAVALSVVDRSYRSDLPAWAEPRKYGTVEPVAIDPFAPVRNQ